MNFRRYIKQIIIIFIIPILVHSQERFDGELKFRVKDANPSSETIVIVKPCSGKTRWYGDSEGNEPYLPTSIFSEADTNSVIGSNEDICAYQACDDPGEEPIPWGIYEITISNDLSGESYTFDLDLRDADWAQPYDSDTWVILTIVGASSTCEFTDEYWNKLDDVDEENINEIWTLYSRSQDALSLKVPITYGTSHYGLEFVVDEDTSYYYPTTTSNYEYTGSEIFKYISPQSRWGYTPYVFTQWKGGGTSSTKSITVDGEHDSYEAIAEYTQTIPTPTGFNIGVRNDHPYLTWTKVGGDSMGGYNIYRNYDREGWEPRTTIYDTSITYFEDIEIDYDAGGDPVSYKIQTRDFEGDTSLCTSAEGSKGYLLTDEPNPSGAADLSSVEFFFKIQCSQSVQSLHNYRIFSGGKE